MIEIIICCRVHDDLDHDLYNIMKSYLFGDTATATTLTTVTTATAATATTIATTAR